MQDFFIGGCPRRIGKTHCHDGKGEKNDAAGRFLLEELLKRHDHLARLFLNTFVNIFVHVTLLIMKSAKNNVAQRVVFSVIILYHTAITFLHTL